LLSPEVEMRDDGPGNGCPDLVDAFAVLLAKLEVLTDLQERDGADPKVLAQIEHAKVHAYRGMTLARALTKKASFAMSFLDKSVERRFEL
jgi:hypothetical protein